MADHGILPAARDLAVRLAAETHATAAFLAGSHTVGLGNETSDVDIYLVGPSFTGGRRQLAIGRTRVDVCHLPSAELETLVDDLVTAPLAADAPPVSDRDVAMAVRLCQADVVTGDEVLAPLRARLTAEPRTLRRLSVDRWLTAAHFEFEDFTGLRRAGDADAALMVGRALLVSAGKAVAACGDDLYAGQKWVWRQLARSGPAGFPLAHFTGMYRRDLDEHGVDELVSLAQTCLIAAATLGWQGVDLAEWPRWTTGDGPLRRSREFLPRAYAGELVVTSPVARRVRLRPEVALVWGLCDGTDEDEVVSMTRKPLSGVYEGLTPKRCRDVIESLRGAGLVE